MDGIARPNETVIEWATDAKERLLSLKREDIALASYSMGITHTLNEHYSYTHILGGYYSQILEDEMREQKMGDWRMKTKRIILR